MRSPRPALRRSPNQKGRRLIAPHRPRARKGLFTGEPRLKSRCVGRRLVPTQPSIDTLCHRARLSPDKLLHPERHAERGAVRAQTPVLVLLAAGRGTRFGDLPKCAQAVNNLPLARHSINAFKSLSWGPVVCVVGYRAEEVAQALGEDVIYVRSENPTGGTGLAAYEAFCVPELALVNPLLILGMGDRIVPAAVLRRLWTAHQAGPREADLTFLTAIYPPPRHRGKGRILRDAGGSVQGVAEQGDIDAISTPKLRRALDALTEGNCPLYAIRARLLRAHLERLSNDNAQRQFYLTDIIESLRQEGAEIRTITTTPADAEYELLCADVTRPADLVALENILRSGSGARIDSPGSEGSGASPLGVRLPRDEGATAACTGQDERQAEFGPVPAAAVSVPAVESRREAEPSDFRSEPMRAPSPPEASNVSPAGGSAARALRANRPPGQSAAIAAQLRELAEVAMKLGFKPDQPVGIGVAGGRLRIAFMHPDMGRFYGPAWQMPIGGADAAGKAQIVVLLQPADDDRIGLLPAAPQFQEKVCSVAADAEWLYPPDNVGDWYSYEKFGTRMAEQLLLALGYFDAEEIRRRQAEGRPLPPAELWAESSLRRPFPLVLNALASIRTVRGGSAGAKVQAHLGRAGFRGLRVVISGDIPCGGFASSSAVTVATLNALNALFELEIPPARLVDLACQAEYGTGVRAGSLDQATLQLGRPGVGTLISSNPRDHYRTLGTYPVPAERFRVLFPYSVDRDREAWRWSAGRYAAHPGSDTPTTGELRKLTGKAAELAALLVRLPLAQDFFKVVEEEFLQLGRLGPTSRRWACETLRRLPLLIGRDALRAQLEEAKHWYVEQLQETEQLDATAAARKAAATFGSLFDGWREPVLRRSTESGNEVAERGVPLRAMAGYLFAEVAKNFQLIHQPDEWIHWVSRSQLGDRSFDIEPETLPDARAMTSELVWEKAVSGPARLARWLERFGARPFDYNRGLSDPALAADPPPELHLIEGTNFFRGLALIDLAEAMLKRAFGQDAVAVRVNAAGQGDFFQVHVDAEKASVEAVKHFIRRAFYRRFGLSPRREFVDTHPGGGAVGARLGRMEHLGNVISLLGAGSA